jgi:hypothetical protein
MAQGIGEIVTHPGDCSTESTRFKRSFDGQVSSVQVTRGEGVRPAAVGESRSVN